MRCIDLYTAIRAVDDDILECSENAACERKKKSGWLKWGVMAACFGLTLTVALTMLPGIFEEARKNELPPTPAPNCQQKVVYETISLDWLIYESVDEL